MNKELDAALVKDFPCTFRNRSASMQVTCMCWGFDCGDGWEPLIRKYAAKIEPLLKDACEKNREGEKFGYYTTSQVKEKFGTLRWYMSGASNEVFALVVKAEQESGKTCEECGNKGRLRGKNWVWTRCNKCWKVLKKERCL